MSILVDVASCKSGLEAFDLLDNVLNPVISQPNRELLRQKYTDEQITDVLNTVIGRYAWAKDVLSGNQDIADNLIQQIRSTLGQRYKQAEQTDVNKTSNTEKNDIQPENTSVEQKERTHITAAKAILEKAQKSAKWDLIQKPFWKMTNSERGDFKRNFSDQREADKFKKEIQFIEQMAKDDRPITSKQKDWLSTIASKYYVSYDKDADKTSTRKLAKDKLKEKESNLGSYEDADMPEYDEKSGKWFDMETGLEIAPPKNRYASKSYF